ncbi:MAG: aldehyde dehydrogenase family protein [Candidatus Krumholzibacteria bacterium]|nr:aldehyde dehydrogenase family protein [Candidatus Krumholzibacteria bacterium]
MNRDFPFYLAGAASRSSQTLDVLCKASGEKLCEVAVADSRDLERALDAAVEAAPAMAKIPSWRRQEILTYVSGSIDRRREELAEVLARESGKTLKEARVEVGRAIETFKVAGEEALRIGGEWMPLDITPGTEELQSIQRRFPIGPCALITPFNFPLNLVAHKVGPAIAAGNPFIVKPASLTPVSALILGEILSEAGLPEGAFSILPLGREDAENLAGDPRMKLLSFTGSPDVGWRLKSLAGRMKVSLELGGNAACVVDEGADLDNVTQRITGGAFGQAGQSCISVQRIFAHRSLYEELRAKLLTAAKALKTGDPLDDNTELGPLISRGDAERVENWIREAVDQGATLLCGGTRHDSWMEASLLEKVPDSLPLSSQEAFGPVAILEAFDDFPSVVERVNKSEYGLQAGFFTDNLGHAFHAFENCEVGGVVIGDIPSLRVDAMPYGGVKASGLGREGLRFAIEEMTEPRLMLLRNRLNK